MLHMKNKRTRFTSEENTFNSLGICKKDGILIYSTCTVTPEENAENTEWLVNNYPFELIGKPEQIMPQDGTGDGFT